MRSNLKTFDTIRLYKSWTIFGDFYWFFHFFEFKFKFEGGFYRWVPLPYPSVTAVTAVYRAVPSGKKTPGLWLYNAVAGHVVILGVLCLFPLWAQVIGWKVVKWWKRWAPRWREPGRRRMCAVAPTYYSHAWFPMPHPQWIADCLSCVGSSATWGMFSLTLICSLPSSPMKLKLLPPPPSPWQNTGEGWQL
jgi:hypothetical protein